MIDIRWQIPSSRSKPSGYLYIYMYTQYITIGEHIIPQLYMGCPQSSYGG